MNLQEERTSYCEAHCRHIYNCKVHWGKDCTRMGGRRIPRMGYYPREFQKEPPEQAETQQEKKSWIKGVLDTVRTRVVGW